MAVSKLEVSISKLPITSAQSRTEWRQFVKRVVDTNLETFQRISITKVTCTDNFTLVFESETTKDKGRRQRA